MVKKKQPDIEQPVSSALVKPREEVEKLLEEQIKAAEPILSMQVKKNPQYDYDMLGASRVQRYVYDDAQKDEFLRQCKVWDDMCREIFIRSFEHPYNTDLVGFDRNNISYIIKDSVEEYKSVIRDKIAYIKGFIQRMSLIPCKLETTNEVLPLRSIKKDANKVFIVHGHAEAVNQEVARTIEKLGLEAIILREQPNSGKTIIEKFEEYAKDVYFAVILLTADDKIEGEDTFRARQNVIFEMGYFMGALGRPNVMCMLQENVEKPGDIDGVVYTMIDKTGVWKYSLVKELKACGYDVDANKVL